MHIKSLVVKIFDSYHYYLIINNLSFKSCYELIKIIKECLNIYDHFPIYFFSKIIFQIRIIRKGYVLINIMII